MVTEEAVRSDEKMYKAKRLDVDINMELFIYLSIKISYDSIQWAM